jgi:hypothetical protein
VKLNRPKEHAGFIDVIKGLKDRFYTVEEFPLINREVLPQGVLLKADSIKQVRSV